MLDLLVKLFGFQWKEIQGYDDLRLFMDAFFSGFGITPPEDRRDLIIKESLSYCKVFGLYKNNELCAGYAFGPVLKTRWYPRVKENYPDFHLENIESYLDLNYVFIIKKYRHSFLSAYLWLSISKKLGNIKDAKYTFTADLKSKGLLNLYKKVSCGEVMHIKIPGHETEYSLQWSTAKKFKQIPKEYTLDLIRRIF